MSRGSDGIPYLQAGTWDGSGGVWNDEAGFPEAVGITDDGDTLFNYMFIAERESMGLALPADYDGSAPGSRVVFAYVDGWNATTELVGGYVFRIDNGTVSSDFGPQGNPLLASIDFYGEADTGKMMVGEYLQWDNAGGWDFEGESPPDWGPITADCCEGARVWHTEELDPCCPDWESACKNPSGPYVALVAYNPDGEQAYAATRGFVLDSWNDVSFGLGDESAFSVSLDDGTSWNQLGLIDTDIDMLSDMAVCPDCSVIYLSSINELECWDCNECDIDGDPPVDLEVCEYCACGQCLAQLR